MFFIGGLFVFVVMFLPHGLAGLLERIRGYRTILPKPLKSPDIERGGVGK